MSLTQFVALEEQIPAASKEPTKGFVLSWIQVLSPLLVQSVKLPGEPAVKDSKLPFWIKLAWAVEIAASDSPAATPIEKIDRISIAPLRFPRTRAADAQFIPHPSDAIAVP